MPLFGSKHKHDDDTTLQNTTDVGGGRHHHMSANNDVNNYPTGTTAAPGMGVSHIGGHQQDFAATNTLPQGQHGVGHHGGLTNQQLETDAAYIGAGGTLGPNHAGGALGAGIPATGVVNHSHNTTGGTGGGTGQRLTGKVESAIGSMIGSSALKAKGLQKEQEANSIKLQGRELAEAERLEREALMRRERAVGHGAHPANSALGAGHIGTGAAGPTGGTGTGF